MSSRPRTSPTPCCRSKRRASTTPWRHGTFQGFDSFQLEGCLAQLANLQAGCERIEDTPLLRQYDYFMRLFLYLFIVCLPLTLVGSMAEAGVAWTTIPIAGAVAFVFAVLGKVRAVNEDPFENRIQDVPVSAICRQIKRDLLEQLGQTELPPRLTPVGGYLF